MIEEQTMMGVFIVLLCLTGLWADRWLLTRTKKGQRLVGWFGESRARWVLRGLFVAGILFGLLLARGIIQPISW